MDDIGFTLISLFEGFIIIVSGIDLGAPGWPTAVVAVLRGRGQQGSAWLADSIQTALSEIVIEDSLPSAVTGASSANWPRREGRLPPRIVRRRWPG